MKMGHEVAASLTNVVYKLSKDWGYDEVKQVLIQYEPESGYYYFGLENSHGVIKSERCHRNVLDMDPFVMIEYFKLAHYKFRKEYVEHGNGD